MICSCIICIQNVVFLSLLRAGAETLAHPGLDPFNVLTKKSTVLVLSRTGNQGAKFESRASRPRPIESEYDGFSRLRVQSAEARMAEVCNGGRSRLCSVLLDFSEKSLNGACRRPSERGQFLSTFC